MVKESGGGGCTGFPMCSALRRGGMSYRCALTSCTKDGWKDPRFETQAWTSTVTCSSPGDIWNNRNS